jgi:succinoglycan biosynthesis protein ExoO
VTSISVIMAAWNAQTTLVESVGAVLNQDYGDFELLIIDDASCDGTLSVARRLQEGDDRIRIIVCEKNGGPAAARNAGLEVARGHWIAVVDSDDCILTERFTSMLRAARTSGADIVFDNLVYVSESGTRERLYVPLDKGIFGDLSLTTYIASHRRSCPIPNLGFLKPLIKAELLQQLNVRYDTSLQISEDAKLILELMAHGAKAFLMPEAYYRYRRRKGSVSARRNAEQHAINMAINMAFSGYMDRYSGRLKPSEIDAMQSLMDDNCRFIKAETCVDQLLKGQWTMAKLALTDKKMLIDVLLELAKRTKRSVLSRL